MLYRDLYVLYISMPIQATAALVLESSTIEVPCELHDLPVFHVILSCNPTVTLGLEGDHRGG